MSEPNTLLEDRLAAALAARAHQVDEHDLAAAQIPGPAHRHRGLIMLAAAACTALVVAVPYTIAQLDDSPPPRPPTSVPPEPTPPTPSATGPRPSSSWPIVRTERADVDGDGTQEMVRLRVEPSDGSTGAHPRARLEAVVSHHTAFLVISGAARYRLQPAADLPGSAGQELLVAEDSQLRVFDLVDGRLKQLAAPDDPPLMRGTDSEGRSVTWNLDDGLTTVRSIGVVGDGEPGPMDEGQITTAQRWRWRVSGGALTVAGSDTGCASVKDLRKRASCVNDPPHTTDPAELSSVSLGYEVHPNIVLPGGLVTTAVLVRKRTYWGGWMYHDDDVTLVVRAGGHTWSAHVGTGPEPRLYQQGVNASTTTNGILVGQPSLRRQAWSVFTVVDGKLVRLTTPQHEPRLGLDPGNDTLSWIDGDATYGGFLFSSYGSGTRKQLYRWDQTGTTFEPVPLGVYCFVRGGVGSPC